ncbi:MAG: hypothetical protein N3G78_09600 [Desulfobacterota bacterium]|nr:hypothetical protein [Thermodesulfobacteriota bacterium]
MFLKRDLTKDWIEALKYTIFPSKGRKEWFVAYQSGKRGLKVPNPLGWMERISKGFVWESYYMSEAIPSEGSLAENPELLRNEGIVTELVKMLLRIHQAGLFHQDLHVGNFLWDGGSLFLTDLHRARFSPSLSMSQKLWNIAQLFHSLRFVWPKEKLERFLDQYFEGDLAYQKKKAFYFQKINSWMNRLEKKQWESRTRRCLKESTEFSVKQNKPFTFYSRRDFPLDLLVRAIERHRTFVEKTPALLVKQSPEVKVSIFQAGDKRICVKQFCYPHWWDRLKERCRRSKGVRAWVGGNGVRVRGVPSVPLLGLAERRERGLPRESLLIMEAPEGEELDRFLCKGFEDDEAKKRFIRDFSQWLSRLHQREVFHQDMKACNILVSREDQQWSFKLLDLEDIRLGKKIDEKRLFKNLLQLNTSIPHFISPKDRLRFIKWYLHQNPVIRGRKTFLRRLVRESRKRGIVYVSPWGVVKERLH